MLFYKFILTKIVNSIILSILILYSVLYIFSIIELLGEKYEMLDTLVIGLINTLELLLTIPNIIFLITVIIFWNNIKKTNELLIIRHYISLKKIMSIFSLFIIIFSILEINKNYLNNHIKDIKEIYLKNSIGNRTGQKIFFHFDGGKLSITRLNGINLKENLIREISIYKFEYNKFINALYSDSNQLINNQIIMRNLKNITSTLIADMKQEYKINLDYFGEGFYNNKSMIITYKNINSKKPIGVIKQLTLFIVLYAFLSKFLSKKGIQRNSNALKYISLSFIIFIYSFITSQIYLENYNSIFHISVLLTLMFYLYKNLINE
tara:strand:+ start:267 stop:1229 length:963 start_codon:yes stop_codon:yes gene_type:complete